MLTGKRILITGGAGAIGSNLVRRLCGENRVVVIDDYSEGRPENLKGLPAKIELVRGDILNDSALDSAFAKKPEIVFHLAAAFANEKSVENPAYDLNVNVTGTMKVLEKSRKIDIKRLVYASSSSCYGKADRFPLSEDMECKPSTPYALSKLTGEKYALLYSTLYGLGTSSVRYFNSYGPGEFPGKYRNVIPNFFNAAMRGKPLAITGTGKETRDFTYVDDAVDGTILAAERKEAVGEAFNIANGKETTVLELANKINKITGNKAGVEFGQRRSWDTVARRVSSIDKARKMLGYGPRVSLDDGLKRTHEWFKGAGNG